MYILKEEKMWYNFVMNKIDRTKTLNLISDYLMEAVGYGGTLIKSAGKSSIYERDMAVDYGVLVFERFYNLKKVPGSSLGKVFSKILFDKSLNPLYFHVSLLNNSSLITKNKTELSKMMLHKYLVDNLDESFFTTKEIIKV